MQTTEAYLGLLRERGKRRLPLERVYRQLFNKNLYLTAYGKIYRNQGAMTPGVTDDTVDAMSLAKIDAIIMSLRSERYQWKPAKRVYIPKRTGKCRPLGLPVWSDKLLAEVVRMILNAYYDCQLSEHAHGFREGRGCHTALQEIYHTWGGATWLIEGDISDCFWRALSRTASGNAARADSRWTLHHPDQEVTRRRIFRGLEIQPDLERCATRFCTQPLAFQYSAR